MELVRQADIARMLGISRQAVSQLIKRREVNDFPPSVAPGLWRVKDVEAWQLTRASA